MIRLTHFIANDMVRTSNFRRHTHLLPDIQPQEGLHGFSNACPKVILVLLQILLLAALALGVPQAMAGTMFGAVYSKVPMLNDNGKYEFVEFDDNGQEVNHFEVSGEYADAAIVSATTIRSYLEQLQKLKAAYPKSQLLTLSEYQTTIFKTAEPNSTLLNTPAISSAEGVKSVLVRGPVDALIIHSVNDLVLAKFPFDVKSLSFLDADIKATLIRPDGTLLLASKFNIGYRSGYFGSDGSQIFGRTHYDDTNHKIHGPMANVLVTGGHGGTFASSTTGPDGKYQLEYYVPACVDGTSTGSLSPDPGEAVINYSSFDPQGNSKPGQYRLFRNVTNQLCAAAFNPTDFQINALILNGLVTIANDQDAVPVIPQNQVNVTGGTLYTTSPRQNEQGPDFQNQGRLKQISENDFKKTDLYVFRDSNGQLLTVREGISRISDTEAQASDVAEFFGFDPETDDIERELGLRDIRGYNAQSGAYYFSMLVRGPDDYGTPGDTFYGKTSQGYERWQTAANMAVDLRRENADHVRVGEAITIVAINRVSGYMGTLSTTLSPSISGGSIQVNGAIVMRPPNLKIWAERTTIAEAGLSAEQERVYLVSGEGAATAGDKVIAVYSEWLTHDNKALPEQLGDFGFTGRLAKVVAPNELKDVSTAGQQVAAQFPIKPGRQIQLVRLEEKYSNDEHYYVQVSGVALNKPENDFHVIKRQVDFSALDQLHKENALRFRPDRYVPFKVPVYDHDATTQLNVQYARSVLTNPGGDIVRPEPVLSWLYRPEYQFTVFDLDVAQIDLETDNTGSRINMLYLINTQAISELDRFNGERQLEFLLENTRLLDAYRTSIEALYNSIDTSAFDSVEQKNRAIIDALDVAPQAPIVHFPTLLVSVLA